MLISGVKWRFWGAVLYSFGVLSVAQACTTAIVTKGASQDGSVFVTHSNDAFCDPSIVYVPDIDVLQYLVFDSSLFDYWR